jgi:DDE_Tnp_1-associated
MDRRAAVPVRSLLEFLAEVPDGRESNRSHPLSAVLALTVCAMLCGARSLYAAAQWGRDHGQPLVGVLGFRRAKSPCVATLHYVFKGLEVAAFEAALARWISQAHSVDGGRLKAVAIDGKTLRGSQGHLLPGVHLLAAFSAQLGVAVGQVHAGEGPGGELRAADELLSRLDLAGVVITGDALFAQRELCAQIVKKGATTC